jgi:hypothetical protein
MRRAPAPRRRAVALAGVALTLLLARPDPASAWGPNGHRVIGEIAWRELRPETKRAVRALLPRGRYDTLAEAATWADTYARDHDGWAWLAPLHYVDTPPDARRVEAGLGCRCVTGAILEFSDALGDPARPHEERVDALRLVAHFVGDVHQPLHVGHPDGSGGASVRVLLGGERTQLHAAWDSGFLRQHLARAGLRWRRFAIDLDEAIAPAERRQWAAERDPRAWAGESLALARRHAFGVRSGTALGPDAVSTAIEVIERRLQQAGVRLAALLDERLAAPR